MHQHLALLERVLEETGPTSQALEDLGQALYRVALGLIEHRERERALRRFEQYIDSSHQRLELFGSSPVVLEGLIVTLEWVWALERAMGNHAGAAETLSRRRDARRRLSAAAAGSLGLGEWGIGLVRLLGKLFVVETAGLRTP